MKAWRKQEAGFTLLEVLAAVTILSVVSLSLTAFFVHAMSYAKGNQNKTVAVHLARNALFFLEKTSFDAFDGYLGQHGTLSTVGCQAIETPDGPSQVVCADDAERTELFKATPYLWEALRPVVNGRSYAAEVTRLPPAGGDADADKEKLEKFLIPIRIRIESDGGAGGKRNSAEVEGYLTNERIR